MKCNKNENTLLSIIGALIIMVIAMSLLMLKVGKTVGYEKGKIYGMRVANEEVELEPCPMCGKNVEVTLIGKSWIIECDNMHSNNGCGLQTGYYEDKEELIRKWNDGLRK